MTTDGGGFTLAMVQNTTLNWGCLDSSQAPTALESASSTVLRHQDFSAMNVEEMYVFETGGKRVLKFYYPRPNTSWVNNYRYFTERTCFNDNHYGGDAPHTGGDREGNSGHQNQACATGSSSGWKARNSCFPDATNSYPSWGNGPGNGTTYSGGSPCWFYGTEVMDKVSQLTNCPEGDRAPWANYNTGDLTGVIQLWVR